MKIKKTFSTLLVALSTLPMTLMTNSCDSSSESSSLESEPIYVTAEQFAAARYSYLLVAEASKLIKITPTQGGAAGAVLPGILSIEGTDIAVPVTLGYELEGNLLGPDLPSSQINASGFISVVFNEDRGECVRFFQELGVIFPEPLAEDTEIVLGAGAGFIIELVFATAGDGAQTALSESNDELGVVMAKWEINGILSSNELPMSTWVSTAMLQGGYSIIRN